MTSSADVTHYALTLGDQDTVTGWYAKEYNASTIKMVIRPKGASFTFAGVGFIARYDLTGFTPDVVNEGDEVKDALGTYYLIRTVMDENWLDTFSHYVCELEKIPMHYNRPATSGTWTLDSDSAITDVRYRQKTFLDTYLASANILEDDGVTAATWITCFSNADYPLSKVLVVKEVDLIFSVELGESRSLIDVTTKSAYAYRESVPIELLAINKTGITAENLINSGAEELRKALEEHPTGASLRSLGSLRETTHGQAPVLYSRKYVLEYERTKSSG